MDSGGNENDLDYPMRVAVTGSMETKGAAGYRES
jgi:hypothetical protein